MRLTLSTFVALAALPAAGAPLLETPVDCNIGDNCYIQNYVDHNSASGYLDFTCGPLSYDGHKGTDFALPTYAAMEQGVNVLASAAGVVKGTRDGMKDQILTKENAAQIEGRDCGNGVVIDHGQGWETQYCHLKQGSVQVAKGDKVEAGHILGQIGLSGRTQFPHLHISVRQGGRVVDPFFPSQDADRCGEPRDAMWADPLQYEAGGLIRTGFETGIPDYSDVKSGAAGDAEIATDAPALVVFAFGFGSRSDDIVDITITGPTGNVMSQSVTLEKVQAQYFRAVGKRTPAQGWPKGTYTGIVTLSRDGEVLDQSTTSVMVK
ncbi:peptidase M23-like protein [Shimia isoporae]|uniref:Peptidase M23-like protein n=1 Tax=Shimia isoporae TaxID=647720 RepID=A0A4R1NS99_9RHOB|nr:M23 family metallopeptidase [Shimia isoporae]TCL08128.1 peptidase M23-like protein [Shimia isoporae]